MLRVLTFLVSILLSVEAFAAIRTQEVPYRVDDQEFTGYLAYDDAVQRKRPAVLVLHEWWGHNAYARKRAEMLAGLGYTAFALDLYGTGKVAQHPDDAKKFMEAVMQDWPLVQKRVSAALDMLRHQPTVDRRRVAAIGYCMGGGIALQMARAGADLDGVVSFHGSLGTEAPAKRAQVRAKILVLTGGADSFVPPEQVKAFEREMRAASAAYEVKVYPGVKHSFTNPEADAFAKRFDMPVAYDESADKDSWKRMQTFLKGIFGPTAKLR